MFAKNDKEWHKEVCEGADYICSKCKTDFSFPCYFGVRGKEYVNLYVCGHHKKTKKAFPKLRLKINNGVCVCLPCHNLIHS